MQPESFIQALWTAIVGALTLDANALASTVAQPYAGWLALCIALLAGISRLAGDSVALFINHVSPRRFGVALVGGGVTFALELVLWAISIWLIATVFFGTDKALSVALMVVALASAPWLFGFLVFAPYFGELVRWVLRIWSWLIVLVLLRDTYGLSLAAAFVSVTVGWLALRTLGVLFARRKGAFNVWLWTRLTGTPGESSFEQQAQELAHQLRITAGIS